MFHFSTITCRLVFSEYCSFSKLIFALFKSVVGLHRNVLNGRFALEDHVVTATPLWGSARTPSPHKMYEK